MSVAQLSFPGDPAKTRRPHAWLLPATGLLWLGLLAAILTVPYAVDSPTRGDELVRNTVRLALLFYGAAAGLLLLLDAQERASSSPRMQLARGWWTLAWTAYLIHLAMAFHHYHHWSHADAVQHTEDVSGFGLGIYFSHVFTLLWTADVVFWWLRPQGYARRSPWLDRMLHGYMAFIIFNGTVVYETGLIRWAGVLLFTTLAVLLAYRVVRNRR